MDETGRIQRGWDASKEAGTHTKRLGHVQRGWLALDSRENPYPHPLWIRPFLPSLRPGWGDASKEGGTHPKRPGPHLPPSSARLSLLLSALECNGYICISIFLYWENVLPPLLEQSCGTSWTIRRIRRSLATNLQNVATRKFNKRSRKQMAREDAHRTANQ